MEDSKSRGGVSRRTFLETTIAAGAAMAIGSSPLLMAGVARAQEPKKGGVLKVGLGGGSTTEPMDPALITAQSSRTIVRQWGDTLTTLTPDRNIEGRLAESFSSNPDATEWTFKIREGVKFHDGSTLTADDVVATYKRHSDKDSKSVALPLVKSFVDIKADGGNVVIKLKNANADLPYLLTDYHLPIQPKGGVDNPGAAIGTGPYKLVGSQAGIRYVFKKNEDDWDKTRGHYDGLELIIINDATARMAALRSGDMHMINMVDPKVAKLLGRAPNLKVVNTKSRAHYCFQAMMDRKPFDNKLLIQAMKYAMNRKEILDKILSGYGTIGNDIPINAAYPFFDETLEQRPFDLEKAAALYKKSGHDGSPIELQVAATAFQGAVDMALLFEASCNKAGIPLKVTRVPDDGYWSNVWGVQPFTADTPAGRPVQDQQYTVFYQSGAEWNAMHYSDAEFDSLLLKARGELDPTKRKELYGQMARKVWNDCAMFIPVFADYVNAHSAAVAGWYEDAGDEMMQGFAPSKTWFA